MRHLALTAVCAMALTSACQKVPITDIGASFSLADATWFEDEETLFFFYQADASQGLSENSQIEITYRTDDLEQPWVALNSLAQVHRHDAAFCGAYSECGSGSIRVRRVPRDVGLRLRYHRDGALTLDAQTAFSVVGAGPAHLSRSLVLSGVFDATNSHVQWRARHQFPNLRNEQVQALGLRRYFGVQAPRYGDVSSMLDPAGNPYGYAFAAACPEQLTSLEWQPVGTIARAIFSAETVPVPAFNAPHFCALSTVTDAKGTFSTAALAQKNPQTRAAFPSLRSPITENVAIGFTLRPCERTISEPHLEMQKQRVQIQSDPELCIDRWRDPGFADQLASQFRTAVDAQRTKGHDMVLALVLHHDETTGAFDDVVEAALAQLLPFEREKSSPRLSGAFVFDSFSHSVKNQDVGRLALWCPANLSIGFDGGVNLDDLDAISVASARSCPLLPDIPELMLGPLKFSSLPILPSRAQYQTFTQKYSEAQAGKMLELHYLAPERTPASDNVPIGSFGTTTFFNNEAITAATSDAFSFCASDDLRTQNVAFRVASAPTTPAPLQVLPDLQNQAPQGTYQLGIGWDFPFLLRLKYEVIVAGAASALSVTVPFGIVRRSDASYGTQLWESGEISLSDVLAQCTRFCDAPTFDSAGVYNVRSPFRTTYAQQCYRPLFPIIETTRPTQGAYPLDP